MHDDDDRNMTMNNSYFGNDDSLLGPNHKFYYDDSLYNDDEQFKPASSKRFYVGLAIGLILFVLIAIGLFWIIVYIPTNKFEFNRKSTVYESNSPIPIYQEHKNYKNFLFGPEQVNSSVLWVDSNTPFNAGYIKIKPVQENNRNGRVITNSTVQVVREVITRHEFKFGKVVPTTTQVPATTTIQTTSTILTTMKIQSTEATKEAGTENKFHSTNYSPDIDGSSINLVKMARTVHSNELFSTCDEYKKAGIMDNGIYSFKLGNSTVKGQCDMSSRKGPFLVLQRRTSNEVSFSNRYYSEYEKGFGNLQNNHWFGLSNLYEYQKLSGNNFLLRIELRENDCLEDCTSNRPTYHWGEYKMSISGPSEKYRLTITFITGNSTYTNSNKVRDVFSEVSNQVEFSTIDQDNDSKKGISCVSYKGHGAWWHQACTHVSLNGDYANENSNKKGGIIWYKANDWRSGNLEKAYYIYPKATLMLVKPFPN
uniref:Fibrinogen C-terminal domain-containing protein n=1 Tax=Rhabditophanes sp. KR3021 TaxID=114890 RepID=A0AC35TUP9_9BILA